LEGVYTVILSNQVMCLECGDEPFSAHRHDFRPCKCGAVSVDGGMEYLRRVGEPALRVDMSIVISQEHTDGLLDAIEDTDKNTLGKLCNVARYLRDEMGINIGDDSE